jgi:hypothetical protein
MKVYTFFELFITVFALYAILEFERDMRIIVPSLCLLTSFLFGRLRTALKEKQGREQRLKYIT